MARILLIHGAYQGGWIWTRVAAQLRAAGHEVLAPSLDGCGERAHAVRPGITTESQAAELASLLFLEDWQEVVAVGTSTGGMVLCRLAELAPQRLQRLVFADALALRHGEALPDIVARPTAVNTALTSGPSRADAEGRLFAELDAETRAWAVARITQHPIAPMTAPVVLPAFWSRAWDARVVWCRRSANPPRAHQRRLAEALEADWQELDTGHYPMLSEPEALARLILAG
ncbi:alpha/beta fold hydrolase [Paracraurococcus lichenis]|uniref:Alpha/beta fold hydrolase n=1 Tax=Paracraurococcus lichenis TaxID=3064888 RepID=A0ABT9DUC6_9PROT|nr:alpha/beta fold hydrolase [Paracraurococcus sp. LOR1-02]MDO9707501.1 alpha/beta fold hydrolase [Paracraurococcus sp. LOR1-02]